MTNARKELKSASLLGPRISKPAPMHNGLLAPALCGCVSCSKDILERRCSFKKGRHRCGDYKGHRGSHTLLIATAFLIAEERVRLDG